MSQTAKEAIFLSRMLKALSLRLDDPLTIYRDNKQTLRLVTEETAKLVTKLRRHMSTYIITGCGKKSKTNELQGVGFLQRNLKGYRRSHQIAGASKARAFCGYDWTGQ